MRNKQRASALISALFIMTLVAIAATAMSTRLQLDIYRTRTSLNSDTLYLASTAVTGWAMDKLSASHPPLIAQDKTGKLLEFPQKLQHIYPGVTIQGGLFDCQAKFNINNLLDKKSQLTFYNLIEHAAEKISDSQRKQIFDATTHWIGSYQPDRGQDNYLAFYMKQTPPYYPSYQPMQNISEFRLIYGVSATLYQALLPNITALPEPTAININTAPSAVLMALGSGLNEHQVNELLQARKEEDGDGGNTDENKISTLLKLFEIPSEQVTNESNYFLSMATTSSGDSHLTVYTLIKRTKNRRGEVALSVVNESLNTF